MEDLDINLSGKLGHIKKDAFPITYVGILSRMKKQAVPKSIDILILISGPEPQRTAFEEMLKPIFKNSQKVVLMICGLVAANKKLESYGNIEMVNYITSLELEETINKSDIVISRSNYTTIMDLAILDKKTYFIPTPEQNEQEYLAKRLTKLGIVPSCKQADFQLEKLDDIEKYTGLKNPDPNAVNYSELLALFKSE